MSKNNKNNLYQLFGFSLIATLGLLSILGSGGGSSGTPPVQTPDSNFVVFMADADTVGQVQLYKYALADGLVTRLNDNLIAGGDITSFAISPDRQWIAYVADQDVDNVFELYVRDAALTTAPIKVSGTLVSDGDVSDIPKWSPNSTRIAYRNNGSSASKFDLTTVAPDGAGREIVSGVGVGPGNVVADSFIWAANSSRIAYLSDQDAAANVELYTSPLNTAVGNFKVNGVMAGSGDVTEYAWAPNSSKIVYRADQVTDNKFELYTSNPDGTSNTPVGGVTGTGFASNVEVASISWAPNSSRIAYRADLTTDEIFNLHTVLPNGTGRIKVNGPLTGNKDVVGRPSWSPDSAYIAYLSDFNVDEAFELFVSQPTVADFSRKVNGTLMGGNVSTGLTQDTPPAWSPDSRFIAYAAEQDTAGVIEIYAGQPNGLGSVKFSGVMVADGNASLGPATEIWAPTTAVVQYRADQVLDGTDELWNSNGTAIIQFTITPVVPTGLQTFAKWSPDSAYLAYASEADTAGTIELYMSTIGGSTKIKISGVLTSGGNVDATTFAWAP